MNIHDPHYQWSIEASHHGLKEIEIDRMASAFEHEDLKMALGK